MEEEDNYINDLLARLSEEREKGKALKRITHAVGEGDRANREPGWWEKRVDELSPQELKEQLAYMEALHTDIRSHLNRPVDHAAAGLEGQMPTASNDPAIEAQARAGPSRENV